jgi:hypothetical protein
MTSFEELLQGGDLRSIGQSNRLVELVDSKDKFDQLFRLLFHPDRKIVMRAADAIEKITITKPDYLNAHESEIINLCGEAQNKELKWHLAQLMPRLDLSEQDIKKAWQTLSVWARAENESRIVRVNALQALFDLSKQNQDFRHDFESILSTLEKENIPSLNARIRKLRQS